MASNDFKSGKYPARTHKLRSSHIYPAEQTVHVQRIDPSHGFLTRGNRIMGPDTSCRERIVRPGRSHDEKGYRGLTLEDYVRGRSSSEKLKPQQARSKHKDSSVIKLKPEQAGMCFQRNYQIQQQDEDNYVENRESRLAEYESILPELPKRDKGHLRTEKSNSDKFQQYEQHPKRTKTISEQDVFVPIHTKERLRLEIRRSLGKRSDRNQSMTRNLEQSPEKTRQKSNSIKLNTISDFYKVHRPKHDLSSIRVQLGYTTKYGRRFLQRIRNILPQH